MPPTRLKQVIDEVASTPNMYVCVRTSDEVTPDSEVLLLHPDRDAPTGWRELCMTDLVAEVVKGYQETRQPIDHDALVRRILKDVG